MKHMLPLLLLLTACGQKPIFTPQQVDVPVEVPCKARMPDAPDWALAHVALTAPMTDKVKGALSELEQRKGYEEELTAAVGACS